MPLYRKTLTVVLLAIGLLSIAGCEAPRPYRDPGYHGRGAVYDETNFQRRIANEEARYQEQVRRTAVQRDHDIAQTHVRLQYRPLYELDREVRRLESYYAQQLENERISHERTMSNILADRDAQRNRRITDGIFDNLPRFPYRR